jgi:hypothetical protein
VEKEAPMKDMVSKKTPIKRVIRVPKIRVVAVAMGETKRAWLMDRPPMKAYSSGVAPGKTSFAR